MAAASYSRDRLTAEVAASQTNGFGAIHRAALAAK